MLHYFKHGKNPLKSTNRKLTESNFKSTIQNDKQRESYPPVSDEQTDRGTEPNTMFLHLMGGNNQYQNQNMYR